LMRLFDGYIDRRPLMMLIERARGEIAPRVGPAEHSVAQAARDFGVSWHAGDGRGA
jgi:hypothetical protein